MLAAPTLMTPRLRLERPSGLHRQAFVNFCASPRAAATGWQRTREAALDQWTSITGHWAEKGFGWLVLTDPATGSPFGTCGPWTSPRMPEGELAWSLWTDEAEGRGLAFEAATAARTFAFRDLGWTTAVSYIAPTNARSAALARRLGATEDGEWMTPNGNRVTVWRHPYTGDAK
jgi:RimJ/RimL family protein N-acetyltransferase